MSLKKELQLLRYSLGQYFTNRKNPNFRKLVDHFYQAKQNQDSDFLNSFHSAYAQFIDTASNQYLYDSLKQFKDIHKGESCFIIGNGPSLNKMDLSLLKGQHCFGMNKIYYIFDRIKLDLSYYVSVNSLVIEQSKAEIENTIQCPAFLAAYTARKCISPLDHIHLLNTQAGWQFHSEISKGISEGYTVTYVALQIAYYMGFEKVFLIGVDHNFQQKGKPNEQQVMKEEDQNHFDPRYFKGQQWHLADLEASEISYNMANFFYQRNGRSIYDATVDGKLDIFPKIDFEKALELSKQSNPS